MVLQTARPIPRDSKASTPRSAAQKRAIARRLAPFAAISLPKENPLEGLKDLAANIEWPWLAALGETDADGHPNRRRYSC
jgi:hypothetical protein